MPDFVQSWFKQHTFVIWLATMLFGGGATYYQLLSMGEQLDKWEPKIEKIPEHQLLITQQDQRLKALSDRQSQSTDRVIAKMDDLIDELSQQNRTVTSAVHALALDVSVLKEKHAKD